MSVPDPVRQLVERFEREQSRFLQPGYNEAQLREQFVNPFFRALGWDLGEEVLHEARLRSGGSVKHPDYTFLAGNRRAFYVETKKPAIDIGNSVEPAEQLRSYGWSGDTALGILTNFAEFAIYDCRIEPKQGDSPAEARVRILTCQQYLEEWDWLCAALSPEAVRQGKHRNLLETTAKGALRVDEAFLRDMESWRADLAEHLHKQARFIDRILNQRELNHLVQRTIDRIVFLRIAEDRNLESYGRLERAAAVRRNVYSQIKSLFLAADQRYNSGLFHFDPADKSRPDADTLSLEIYIVDNVLRRIIGDLYPPRSRYQFSVISADILGQVYERFLGKVIEARSDGEATTVTVAEKPEVRKAGGVYYTPAYIVDYIVENTVGALLADKTPEEAMRLRVLDPACGSGSFLTGAYDYLLDWHLAQYQRQPERYRNRLRRVVGGYVLDIREKRRILLDNIYGVDLDQNAVEVSKLALLLKMLENEGDAADLEEPLLPDLSGNIKWGNSLIGSDFFSGRDLAAQDDEELLRVKPFDWASGSGFGGIMAAGGFDAVIGNPPYVRMEEFKDIKPYLRSKYTVHADRMDLYGYFVEREHELLRDGGLFGMIVSNKFIKARYGKKLRNYIADKANLKEIFDLAGLPVFSGATVRTVIILSTKGTDQGSVRYVAVMPVEDFESISNSSMKLSMVRDELSYSIQHEQIAGDNWNFAPPQTYNLLNRLQESNQSLVDFISPLPVCMGVKSGLTDAFIIDESTQREIIAANPEAEEIIKPLLNGRDIRKYQINYGNNHLIYAYHGVDIARFPAIEKYLSQFRERLENRATKQEWYELQQPQFRFAEYMNSPKIIFPDIGTTTRFALDTVGYYGTNTTYFLPVTDKYLLCILNSQLAQFYFEQVCAGLEGTGDTYLRFFGQYLSGFPIRAIDFDNSADVQMHADMVALVDEMLGLHKQLAGASAVKRGVIEALIERTDKQIDGLVYRLYGLSGAEVKIVEG